MSRRRRCNKAAGSKSYRRQNFSHCSIASELIYIPKLALRLRHTDLDQQEYDDLCLQAAQEWVRNDEDKTNESENHVETIENSVEGDAQIGRYANIKHHKDGLFSNVFKAAAPDGQVVALKVTTPSAMSPPHDSEREVRILKEVPGPNIITLLDSFHQSGRNLVLVFPFKPTDLEQVLELGSLSEQMVRSIIFDLFGALGHLHSIDIIHRDVKPSNILLDSPSGPAYLADFGIAWSPRDSASESVDQKITDVGTTSYRPPELLFGHRAYDRKLDMWAAGCVLAEAVASPRRTLFDSGPLGSELALLHSIFKSLGTPSSDTWPEVSSFPDWGKMDFVVYPPKPWKDLLPDASEGVRDLVSKLVCYESSSRLNAAEACFFRHAKLLVLLMILLQARSHEFFTQSE
ncbi:MAG: hypothetical protein M1816_003915 [Peltula sp. TS41687]|nr:MAG: hypothetical protein M1816_003915 [Peltula sp. TS41687]